MKKRRKSLLLRLAVCAFFVYVAVKLISQQVQINQQKTELASLQKQAQQQVSQNTELQRSLNENNDQYMENVARDKLGYAKSDERIYINVPGS